MAKVEELREKIVGGMIGGIQALARGYVGRKIWAMMRAKKVAAEVLQRAIRSWLENNKDPWWRLTLVTFFLFLSFLLLLPFLIPRLHSLLLLYRRPSLLFFPFLSFPTLLAFSTSYSPSLFFVSLFDFPFPHSLLTCFEFFSLSLNRLLSSSLSLSSL